MVKWVGTIGLCLLVLACASQRAPAAPSDLTTLQRSAQQALKQQDWARAAQLYRQLTRSTPGSMAAWGNLGNALKHLGRYDEAAGALTRAERLNPASPSVKLDLALVYIAADRYREAILPLQAALHFQPGNPRLLQLLGLCQLNSNHYQAAVQNLQSARKGQAKPNLSLLYTLAEAQTLAGQQGAALQTLQEMLRHDQNQPALHLLLGEALLYEGRSADAEAEFQRAHTLDRAMPEPELWLGLAEQKQHHLAKACDYFKAAVKLQPDCLKCLYELGATEYLIQDRVAAERDLKRCIALGGTGLRPGQPNARTVASAWYYSALLERDQHHLRRAASDLRNATRLNPNEPAPHYQLGSALAALGQHAAAEQQFKVFQQLRHVHQQTIDNIYRQSFERALESTSKSSR